MKEQHGPDNVTHICQSPRCGRFTVSIKRWERNEVLCTHCQGSAHCPILRSTLETIFGPGNEHKYMVDVGDKGAKIPKTGDVSPVLSVHTQLSHSVCWLAVR